jgi:hypothetical protein
MDTCTVTRISTLPGGNPTPPPGNLPPNMVETCAHCGSQHIVDDVDWTSRTKERKCGMCGRKRIILAPAKPANIISDNYTQTPKESTPVEVCNDINKMLEPLKDKELEGNNMSKEKVECDVTGCTKHGAFDGMCAAHFKDVHGIRYLDYARRRKTGETKEAIFASVKSSPDRHSRDGGHTTLPPGIIKRAELDLLPGKIISKREAYEEAGLVYPDNSVLVDFSNRQDLLATIEALAQSDFRTPAQQILYLISQADKILQRANEVI